MQDEQVVSGLDGDHAVAEAAASAAAARVGVPAPARPEVAGALTKPVTPQAGLGGADEPEAAEAATPEVGEPPEPLDDDSEDFVEAWEGSADEPDAEAFEVEESEEEPAGLEVEPELSTTPETLRPSSGQRSQEPAPGGSPQTPPSVRPWGSGGGVRRKRLQALHKPEEAVRTPLTPEQRLLLLDTWRRSALPAKDFADLVGGITSNTLYCWKRAFEEHGPAGLMDKPRKGGAVLRISEVTRRAVLMLKEQHPEWGCQRLADMLLRGPALPVSPTTVAKILHEAGYQSVQEPTHPHPDKVRSFERAQPNQLWQTDLFTFVLKRQNRRVYLVAFMDDHSRFIVSYGLHAGQSTALVLETLRVGIANHGRPEEILTDNGAQYVTWRDKSAFTKELEKHGIKQIVAKPRRPQTMGKIERFWGTLWRECLGAAVFVDLADAQTRLGHFIDYYNFQRPHQSLNGLVPADRFFGATAEVLQTLKARVAVNGGLSSLSIQTGQTAGKTFAANA